MFKKMSIILIVLLILLSFFAVPSFATPNNIPIGLFNEIKNYDYDNYLIYHAGDYFYIVFFDNSTNVYVDNYNSNDKVIGSVNGSLFLYRYLADSNTFEYRNTSSLFIFTISTIVYSTNDIFWGSSCSSIYFPHSESYNLPSILHTVDSLSTGKFDNIFIDFGSFDTVEPLGITIWQVNDDYDVQLFKYDSTHSFPIDGSRFLYQTNSNSFLYRIPSNFIGITYKNNIKYKIVLDNCQDYFSNSYLVFDEKIFTVGGMTQDDIHNQQQDNLQGSINKNTQDIINSNKETQNKLDEQTNSIKEQTETNKNIFQKIGDILDLLNPFSENFFGRKLVELILDGFKSLFIPEDDFFSNYFDEIKNWFSDRLGFLWSPFDLIIDILTRISSINFDEPTFTIPDIYEPFTNNKIISSHNFNFNDLLEHNSLKVAHDIYLILVDAFIVFNLYKLAQDKLEEVFTK